MYGTIFRMKVKQGRMDELIKLFKAWDKEHQPNVQGALGGFVLLPDANPGTAIGVAIFDDEASFRANGERPEQDAWFRSVMALLEEDPTWEDGHYVAGSFG